MKILVVDDSAYARKSIVKLLTGEGHEVIEAGSGKEALEIYVDTRPDLVTVDLLMSEMDGLELIGRLRGTYPGAKIIVFSADVQEATKKQALRAGASAFVSKVEKSTGLLDAIRDLTSIQVGLRLTEEQRDALTELMNLATGQAAKALGSLLDRRVHLVVPMIRVMRADDLRVFLDGEAGLVGAMICQTFQGAITGQASMLFPKNEAEILVRSLFKQDRDLERLSAAEQTVLSEVGNIVLNSAIARLADQMKTRLRMSLPSTTWNLDSSRVLNILLEPVPEGHQAVVLLSRLTLDQITVTCFLILVMTEEGIRALLRSMET